MTNLGVPPSRVIARSEATRQSREGTREFAGGLPMLRLVPRDCHALLRKARTDKLGGLLHLKEGNDNLGGIPDLACK